MIAFITLNHSLVPLIEGLCSSNHNDLSSRGYVAQGQKLALSGTKFDQNFEKAQITENPEL